MVLYLSIRYGTILYILFETLNTGFALGSTTVGVNKKTLNDKANPAD